MSHQQPVLQFWGRKRLPLLLQTEAAECGLASLAMVAGYWGLRIDLANMRRRFSVSLKGTTLKSLIAMAQGLGLQPRPLKLDMQHLPQLQLPCVLHWDMNHFVVLKAVAGKHIVIHDPAVGERKLPLAEASKHFTGVALELTPGNTFRKAEARQQFSLLSLMGRVDGLGRGIGQLLLLGIALQVCALAAPFYLQWVVDEALVAADRNLVTVLGIGFLLLVLLQTAIGAVRSWAATVLATSLNFQWLGHAFAHLLRLPLPWFEKRHLGDIVSRFGSIQTIQRSLTTQFVEGVIDGLLVLATLGVMLLYSPSLAAVSLVAVALYALLRWSIFRALREATAEQIVHASRQSTHFMESARGVQSVRLFGRQEERRIGWMNALAEQFNADLRISRLSITFQTANTLLFSAERVVVVWLAALAVMDNRFSVGMLFAFLSYKDQFSQRIAALIDKLFELRMLRLHGERVADIVLTEPEPELNDVELDPAHVQPTLEVRNVAFRYADSEPYVLKDLNLTVPAGQCLAITGASGCGKTTLLKLMLGLMEPTEGEILVGGIQLKQLGLSNYRKLLGTVMQDDQLFAGSIADNICFFDPQPDQERIRHCAGLAAIHDEIMAMPMTYNTLVGDIGSGLSGGQKQRILLARSLYKQPRLLVLDEATSHLDVWNEKLVNAAIRNISMTRLLVAHRPETIAMAERVVVLEQGRIVQDTTVAAAPACASAGTAI
ncbi:peptidase domain-containing ABC transporter [Chromobacterium subtsugae]|uniref:Peptidase domain-containing ABC transporter n=1 Tax=Chromobacterium subtsugae TaxID=251747 RepID=A0ABS7FAC8_9NEIS|nr:MULTISPECIES: peptidase domain-containing ABC transporter [Chromobacterium]KUM04288.1 ABC transporter ATP-binding protein [Chromobacterium subtsugae]KZE83299.1 ABC transporter ATP-binding protein [Chromobacterium sp. F49]MBW7565229.1 peptidase domain-containing ABC transporter [Chromobacterium subtsugae]MBW8286243.1 peptidase domain-containing ABC transporter [Chromobacterium subtsugae]OBU87858.1 ABC transporter ATP-binding protein [Chromobacterium subtsugae]